MDYLNGSLILTTLSLADFFIKNFPNFWWYPDWYLGNPFNYLIGPVVPVLLGILNFHFSIINEFSILQKYLALIFLSLVFGGIGLYYLVKNLGGDKKQSVSSALFFLLLPISYYLLANSNGLHHLAFGFLPWILLLFNNRFDKKNNRFLDLFLSISIAFVLLIEVSILLPIIVGLLSLISLARPPLAKRKEGFRAFLILLLALSIATIWYTPMFWWVTLSNPSFGGLSLLSLVKFLGQLLLSGIPLMLAYFSAKGSKNKKTPLSIFGISFLGFFLFLSLIRFLSDPDFVMDWIGFFTELQFGAAVLLSEMLRKFKIYLKLVILCLVLLLTIAGWQLVYKNLIKTNKTYESNIIDLIQKNVPKDQRIFLSGSDVFFLNYYLNQPQVRGGMDQTSYHPFWAHAAYQIREGKDPKLTKEWLKALGVSFILIHQTTSADPFHDFKQTGKFSSLNLINQNSGDQLYRLEDSSLVRLADKNILTSRKPKDGSDYNNIYTYTSNLKQSINYKWTKPNQIEFDSNLNADEVVSLAITGHPDWIITQGQGQLKADKLGNLIFIPGNFDAQKITLTFEPKYEWVLPALLSVIFALLILKLDFTFKKTSQLLSELSFGLEENE